MVEKLRQLGYDISETEVLTIAGDSRSISRSHIGRVLVEKGYFPTVQDAFEAVLQKGKPAYVPHYHLEVEEIISLIREAGGTSVLAHPKLVGDDDLVRSICQCGIDGIELSIRAMMRMIRHVIWRWRRNTICWCRAVPIIMASRRVIPTGLASSPSKIRMRRSFIVRPRSFKHR